jgi:hypothetical protein
MGTILPTLSVRLSRAEEINPDEKNCLREVEVLE